MKYYNLLKNYTKLPEEIITYILCEFWPDYDSDKHAFYNCCKSGNLETVKLLYKHNLIEYTYTRGCCIWYCIDTLFSYGRLEILKFLQSKNIEIRYNHYVELLIAKRHTELFKYLYRNKYIKPNFSSCIHYTIQYGSLNILKFILESYNDNYDYNSLLSFTSMDRAAERGYLKLIKFIYKYRKERCTIDGYVKAIKNKKFNTAKFLYQSECWDEKSLKYHKPSEYKYDDIHNNNMINTLRWATSTYNKNKNKYKNIINFLKYKNNTCSLCVYLIENEKLLKNNLPNNIKSTICYNETKKWIKNRDEKRFLSRWIDLNTYDEMGYIHIKKEEKDYIQL